MGIPSVKNDPKIFDPFSAAPLNPPPVPRMLQASLSARVWPGVQYAAIGAAVGAGLGGVVEAYIAKETEKLKKFSPTKIGIFIGGILGALYTIYRDHHVHIQLQTHLVTPDTPLRKIALEKANTIFRTYATAHLEKDPAIFDENFNYTLFVYPVKAEDEHIYEHSEICRFLTENYPRALEAYERQRQQFPDDPNLFPPSSSPHRAGTVSVDNLYLHLETMQKISEVMFSLFEQLKKWDRPMQTTLDHHYQTASVSPFSELKQLLTEEQVKAVDEKALATKLSKNEALSLEEVFVIRQLFHFYIVEIKERDSRIYKAINFALSKQLTKNKIDIDRHRQEMDTLNKWHTFAKRLYA